MEVFASARIPPLLDQPRPDTDEASRLTISARRRTAMYEVHRTDYGVKIVFQGFLKEEELRNWSHEVAGVTKLLPRGFCVLHDMRGMRPLPPEARQLMKRNMEEAKRAGMRKSAQIVDDAITAMQFKRLANEVGIAETTRQINASLTPDCERAAVDWIVKGIDPDTRGDSKMV